jgi:hypothetical protein
MEWLHYAGLGSSFRAQIEFYGTQKRHIFTFLQKTGLKIKAL